MKDPKYISFRDAVSVLAKRLNATEGEVAIWASLGSSCGGIVPFFDKDQATCEQAIAGQCKHFNLVTCRMALPNQKYPPELDMKHCDPTAWLLGAQFLKSNIDSFDPSKSGIAFQQSRYLVARCVWLTRYRTGHSVVDSVSMKGGRYADIKITHRKVGRLISLEQVVSGRDERILKDLNHAIKEGKLSAYHPVWPITEVTDQTNAEWVLFATDEIKRFEEWYGWPSSSLTNKISSDPAFNRKSIDITKQRGARRRIIEAWDAIESEYGPNADGTQVKRVLDREKATKSPTLKTVQNHLATLRNENLIP
jgi:hypothetical protein